MTVSGSILPDIERFAMKKGPGKPSGAFLLEVYVFSFQLSPFSSRLLKQAKHRLRQHIGLGQHGNTCLLHDLGFGQHGCFGREVRIHDRAEA